MQKSEKKDESQGVKSEFWGICVESGKRYSQMVCKKFHISMAALDPTDTLTSPCVSLMVERDGCQYLLCSLKPDSILQVILNLYFDKGENITFFLKGHGTVHLSGYYICDEGDASNTDSAKKDGMSALSKKLGKKAQTSFTISEDVEEESSDDDEESSVEEVPVKGKIVSPIKKVPAVSPIVNLKKTNQKPVSKKEESSEDEEEESSDEDDSEDEDTGKDGELLKAYTTKRVHSTIESAEESSDDDDDSEDDEPPKKASPVKQPQSKKLKAEASTPAQNKMGQKTPKSANFLGVSKLQTPDLNSSIGRTPMPKKPAASVVQKTSPIDAFLAKMKNQSKTPEKDSSDSDDDMETSAIPTPEKPLPNNQLNTSAQGESAKKKKKKKKSKAAANENQEGANKSPAGKPKFSQKLPSGIEYDDIRMGNGLPAKKGKLVHVYYTGKLENDKVFDSCTQGSKPFSFKLASGQVIKGWDLGIEGMKVGGKRRLKIPPNMGYANKRTGPIPPNSTLYFDVELKAVS